ncbi:MAG: hypothetical protein J1F63_00470 [Oscillospiraceae bacterium]|nr:hypothetical protein [Oscillospiraceae bacterium]
MAIRRLKKSRYTSGGNGMYRSIFALDSESDITKLPTNTKGSGEFGPVACDSVAVVIGDGSGACIYGLNSSGEWVKIYAPSGPGGQMSGGLAQELTNHLDDKNNPHEVTSEQLGLSEIATDDEVEAMMNEVFVCPFK